MPNQGSTIFYTGRYARSNPTFAGLYNTTLPGYHTRLFTSYSLAGGARDGLAISPDGSKIVYKGENYDPNTGTYTFFLKTIDIDGNNETDITTPSSEFIKGAFLWTEDGSAVVYVTESGIKKTVINGGTTTLVSDTRIVNELVLVPTQNKIIYKVTSSINPIKYQLNILSLSDNSVVTVPNVNRYIRDRVSPSPDGTEIVYYESNFLPSSNGVAQPNHRIYKLNLNTLVETQLISDSTALSPSWSYKLVP